MDQQVSPAVVIIVLILIVAILVGLYFLVVERGPAAPDEEAIDGVFPDEDHFDPEADPAAIEIDDVEQETDNGDPADHDDTEAAAPDDTEGGTDEDPAELAD